LQLIFLSKFGDDSTHYRPPHPPPMQHLRYLICPLHSSWIYIYDSTFSLGTMRQKLITLDPTSWDRAQKKDNFSEWVRKQLQLEVEGRTISALEAELEVTHRRSESWYRKCVALMKEGKGRDQE